MKTSLVRGIGFSLLVDGLFAILFGRLYVRLFRFGPISSPYRRIMDWILERPSWQIRLAGALEFSLGTQVLSRLPLNVHTLYSSIARPYAAIDPGWRQSFYPKAHESFDNALRQFLPPAGRVLDLGCGIGANLGRILDLHLPFSSYMGVDLTDAMLEQARKRYQHIPNAVFLHSDLISEPLPEGPFDLILSTWVFEHLSDPNQVSSKAWERLSPGGHMVLLFEVKANTLLSNVIERLYRFFSARLVRENEIRRFPGFRSSRRFNGPLGDLALVILEK